MPARASRVVRTRLKLQARLLVDMGYAAIELAFDEPELDQNELAASAAKALAKLVAEMTRPA